MHVLRYLILTFFSLSCLLFWSAFLTAGYYALKQAQKTEVIYYDDSGSGIFDADNNSFEIQTADFSIDDFEQGVDKGIMDHVADGETITFIDDYIEINDGSTVELDLDDIYFELPDMPAAEPADGQILFWNGTSWQYSEVIVIEKGESFTFESGETISNQNP